MNKNIMLSNFTKAFLYSFSIAIYSSYAIANSSPNVEIIKAKTDVKLSWDKEFQLPFTKALIKVFKNKNWQELASNTRYPIKLSHPIDPIQDNNDFIKRFDLIFDQETIAEIAHSDPIHDWSLVGSQGIMFKNGQIWISKSGDLIAVNRNSQNLNDAIAKLREQNIAQLVFNYQYPLVTAQVHEFNNKQYRLSLWINGSSPSEKPDYILTNGRRDKYADYVFFNNGYKISLVANDPNPDIESHISIEDNEYNTHFSDGIISEETIRCCADDWQDFIRRDKQKELAKLVTVMQKMTEKIDEKAVAKANKQIANELYANYQNAAGSGSGTLKAELKLKTIQLQVYEIPAGKYQLMVWQDGKNSTQQPDLIMHNGKLNRQGNYNFRSYGHDIEIMANGKSDYWKSYVKFRGTGAAIKGYYFNGVARTEQTAKKFNHTASEKSLSSIIAYINRQKHKQLEHEQKAVSAAVLITEILFPRFTVRIEKLSAGLYQYSSWSKAKATTEKPDLVLKNGEFDNEGTYQFKNGNYFYKVIQHENDAEWQATLQVKKGNKTIFVDKLKHSK